MNSRATSLAASAISGVRWNYIGAIGSSLCSLLVGVVLARILGPKPYGQVIIATTIYGFANLFVDGGFGQALIQTPHLDPIQIRKTFTCQIGLGMCASAVAFLLAAPIAHWFHDPSAKRVIEVMSTIIAFQALGLVSAALLRRAMKFKTIQMSALVSYLFGYLVVGIPLACLGAGVWSLVLAYLSQCLLNSLLLYWAVRHPLALAFGFPDRSITTFGGTIIANNVVNWGHANLDNLAVSHLGPMALGLYGRASNFAYQPATTVVNSLQSVLLSSTAKVQERRQLLHDLTLSAVAVVFGVLGPAYATIALLPQTTIVGLYGDKWLGVIPLMVPLAMAMPFFGAHGVLGPILTGLGRPDLEFWPQAISCVLAAAAYFTAARFSLDAIAWALLVVTLLRFWIVAAFTFSLLEISWIKAGMMIAKRILFSFFFGATVWFADRLLRLFIVSSGLRLAGVISLSAVLLGWSIWSAGTVVFGRHTVSFLLAYAPHLPTRYVQRLKLQVRPEIQPFVPVA